MFEQSVEIEKLATAIMVFHSEVGKVKKDASNSFFKSKYASLSNILDAIEEPLQKAGLVVLQFPSGEGLVTQLVHTSGQYMRALYTMPVKEQNNPQAVGSAITYARRYALAAVLSLNIDEDDDGNAASQRSTLTHSKPLEAQNDNSSVMSNPPRDIDKLPQGSHLVTIMSTIEDSWTKDDIQNPMLRVITNKGESVAFNSEVMHELAGRDGQQMTLEVALTKAGKLYIRAVS